MELIHCHIENFGTLSNKAFEFSSGLNAICMENGMGKSTLLSFLKCMLYGLSDNRSHDLARNDRMHFLPWQGGSFGGSLTLRQGEKTFRLVRRFGSRPADDTLQVYDESNGTRTDALGAIPGKTLLGIDAEGFSLCAFFSEHGSAPGIENASLIEALGETNATEGESLQSALERLGEARRTYEKKGGRGQIAEAESEIAAMTARHIKLQKEAAALQEKEAAFFKAKEALSAFSHSGRTEMPKSAVAKKRKGRAFFAIFLSVLILFASVALSFFSPHALLGILLSVPPLFIAFSNKNKNNRLQNQRFSTREKTNSDLFLSESEKEFDTLYHACAQYERAFEAACAARDEAAYLSMQIEASEKRLAQMKSSLSDIKKTEELLTLAERRFREGRTRAVHTNFEKHLRALGTHGSEDYRLSDRLCASFLSHESYHEADSLSRGGKDRAELARTLALLSSLPKDKKPPLLLDDPFLSYDDTRIEKALRALESLAENYQILYLTCSHSRMP